MGPPFVWSDFHGCFEAVRAVLSSDEAGTDGAPVIRQHWRGVISSEEEAAVGISWAGLRGVPSIFIIMVVEVAGTSGGDEEDAATGGGPVGSEGKRGSVGCWVRNVEIGEINVYRVNVNNYGGLSIWQWSEIRVETHKKRGSFRGVNPMQSQLDADTFTHTLDTLASLV